MRNSEKYFDNPLPREGVCGACAISDKAFSEIGLLSTIKCFNWMELSLCSSLLLLMSCCDVRNGSIRSWRNDAGTIPSLPEKIEMQMNTMKSGEK